MNDNIHQFAHGKGSRGSKGHVGVLLAVRQKDGKVVITGSKANLSHGDRFNKEDGLELAWNRQATVREGRKNKIAHSMKGDLNRFVDRCSRYFKTKDIEVPELSKCESKVIQEKTCIHC